MMKLYPSAISPFSHRCCIMLYEKGMDFQIIDVDPHTRLEERVIPDPFKALSVVI